MKKLFALLLTAVLVLSLGAAAFADDAKTVYVTISNGSGTPTLAVQEVSVTDLDGDGVVSIADSLTAVHDLCYAGGAAEGFACEQTEYGISMTKLWGVENGGSYGYSLNNATAYSLADPVENGDLVTAYAYADLTAWSDMYSWLEAETLSVSPLMTLEMKKGEEITLTLNGSGFDADWNPVTVPVEGAELTVNGTRTGLKTDAEGHVTFKADQTGELLLSAVSDTQVLVPSALVVTVPATGLSVGWMIAIAAVVLVAAAVAVAVILKKRK